MDHSKSVAGAAAMLLACVFAAPSASAAGPNDQARTVNVNYQDLNLDTNAGVEALYRRIHSAAQRVCAVSGQTELGASAEAKCSKEAEAQAVEQINLPALTAFAANR